MNGVLRDAVRMSGLRVRDTAAGYPLDMTEHPTRTTEMRDDRPASTRSAPGEDNLHVTPDVAGPSGTGEETDRGGDDDAGGVSKGADRGGN